MSAVFPYNKCIIKYLIFSMKQQLDLSGGLKTTTIRLK